MVVDNGDVHPFVKFCADALCSPDTDLAYGDLAARYTRYTGRPMTAAHVERLVADWRAHCETVQSITVGTFRI